MKINFDLLKQQEEQYSNAAVQLDKCKTVEETNQCLALTYRQLNIQLPWHGYTDFDSFMKDRKATLTFA